MLYDFYFNKENMGEGEDPKNLQPTPDTPSHLYICVHVPQHRQPGASSAVSPSAFPEVTPSCTTSYEQSDA